LNLILQYSYVLFPKDLHKSQLGSKSKLWRAVLSLSPLTSSYSGRALPEITL
jgi:hypothetical protein